MALLLAGALMLGAAMANEETLEGLAAEVGVDPIDLQGAAITTGTDPWTYLVRVGLVSPPPPPEPGPGVWDRLAVCESTSNWRANTGNGYHGGVQMDMTFWRRYGGLAFAPRPDLATRGQQIQIAERGLAVQGWGAWPACSRRLGLR